MRVLVIEDNPRMAEGIRRGLVEHGYVSETCDCAAAGERRAASDEFDIIVLDRMLPDRDGVEVCRSLRRREVRTPILMLTALADTNEKVLGLDAGADDYLTKPFEFDELIARVRALLRRGQATESRVLKYHDLELNLDKRSAVRAGEHIRLSAREFALLEFLIRNPNRVLTRHAISERVWDAQYEPSSNVIDVVISNLRRKADRQFDTPLIHTVIGAGYRFGVLDEAGVQRDGSAPSAPRSPAASAQAVTHDGR
ncbi:MAG: response regulator transcription factor [Phycisphaerales bacterium]|nr:response regulator transcription factor [Phycisphaerales bacterium]